MPDCPPIVSDELCFHHELEVPERDTGELLNVLVVSFECPHCCGPLFWDTDWLENTYDNTPLHCGYCGGLYRFQGVL